MEVGGHLHAPDTPPPPSKKSAHCVRWIGDWMGLGTGLDAVAKKSHHYHCRELNTGRPARILVSMLTELLRLPMLT